MDRCIYREWTSIELNTYQCSPLHILLFPIPCTSVVRGATILAYDPIFWPYLIDPEEDT
jgi:hypothetical protein